MLDRERPVTPSRSGRSCFMVRWFSAVSVLLVVSCSGTTTALRASPSYPSPSLSASPAASASPEVPACQLPAMLWTYPNRESQGGFIDSLSGNFTADPQSVMVFDPSKGLYRTPSQPYLYGNWGDSAVASTSYDPSHRRWLPVPPQWVSPDGSSYAYAVAENAPGGGVHVVDVSTAADRVVPGTTGIPNANYFVVGFLRDAVYLVRFGPTGGAGLGLWRLNPTTNSITQVSTDAPAVGVFVGETPLQDPSAPVMPDAWWTSTSADFSASSDPYVYFQYLTGDAGQHGEDWFQRPGLRMNVVGVDLAGRAIVVAQSPSQIEVWLLATPNDATELHSIMNNGSPDLPFKSAVAQGAGWWIGSKSGVFFATTRAFTQVSQTSAVIAGRCG